MSNYPDGAENDPRAPWNQEDAKPAPHWVTVSIRIDAISLEHAAEQAIDLMAAAKVADDDFEIENVWEE